MQPQATRTVRFQAELAVVVPPTRARSRPEPREPDELKMYGNLKRRSHGLRRPGLTSCHDDSESSDDSSDAVAVRFG
jgi:hypothetical protein